MKVLVLQNGEMQCWTLNSYEEGSTLLISMDNLQNEEDKLEFDLIHEAL